MNVLQCHDISFKWWIDQVFTREIRWSHGPGCRCGLRHRNQVNTVFVFVPYNQKVQSWACAKFSCASNGHPPISFAQRASGSVTRISSELLLTHKSNLRITDFLKVEDSDPHKNGPHPQQGIQFYFYLARRTCMAASRAWSGAMPAQLWLNRW